jgi:hypothetical protein
MKVVLHPAMGSMERVCAAEGHTVVEAVAAILADGSGSTAGTRGLNLARRYEEEAMMRLAVVMVDDSNREVLFRRRDGAIHACQLIVVVQFVRGFYVEERIEKFENGFLAVQVALFMCNVLGDH